MQYFYDGTQSPFSRLKGVLINGAPVDPAAVYSVTANEAVLQILDLLGLPYSNVQLYAGITEFQVLTDYIINHGGFIHPKTLGRIINVGDLQSRGLVLANGWMNSEKGFYLEDPSNTGKLFFSINLWNRFNSGEPAGFVYLNLRNANFRFRSSDCDWLLIENSVATILGTGKINGSGNYGFLITAMSELEGIDCPQGGLRIIVWDINDGERIVYDNLMPTLINGGNIFIKNYIGDDLEKLLAEEDGTINLPEEYSLEQNYPNPFNPSTTIKYSIPEAANVQLKVYDILGNEVATLVNEAKAPDIYEVQFNASQIASGVYIYSLRAGNFVHTKKMILIK
jgi:hypothetical protein